MCTEHPEAKEKREFSDTNFRSKGLADILTECFSIHQGESIQLKHSVETSARFPILKLALENSLFHLCGSQLRSNHFKRLYFVL